ncbi:hypothetical protein [Streptomyces sp. HF10]|uniref:hypothetical protein n=1 Tax=Streptomyces sp. HF10 TaxID=2692233 RepID=UPI001315AF99|nr:hypothetical protein [Streptomyces sp. HF10]QHC30316.1 hypothetical protein GR129_17445 [Streptomyces sp. HF10]
MGTLGRAEFEAMIDEATVDAYGEDEQRTGLFTMLEEYLDLPFTTTVLGIEVMVCGVDLTLDGMIVALCSRSRVRQSIGILDLPLPSQAPEGANGVSPARAEPRARGRIEAYRHWAG